jgi:RimJ/RimL family protein N-acetyltransferase
MTGSKPEIRPATHADLVAFYGKPPSQTSRSWVGVVDGTVLAVFGLVYKRGRPAYFFSDLAPEARRYRIAIMRAARMMLDQMGQIPVPAFADPGIPAAGRFLERLGFRFIGEVDGQMVYLR